MSNELAPLLADISFGELLWSLVVVFFMVTFFVILFNVIVDIFRSHDLSGMSKAIWVLFIVILPFIGLLAYLVVRGDKMAQRQRNAAAETQEAFDDYVRGIGGGPAAEIASAKQLLDAGTITEAEFEEIKRKALA